MTVANGDRAIDFVVTMVVVAWGTIQLDLGEIHALGQAPLLRGGVSHSFAVVLIRSKGVLDRPLDVLVATSLAGRGKARVSAHNTCPISVPASNLLASLIEGLVDARRWNVFVKYISHIRVIRVSLIGLDLHHSDGVDHALGSRAIQM